MCIEILLFFYSQHTIEWPYKNVSHPPLVPSSPLNSTFQKIVRNQLSIKLVVAIKHLIQGNPPKNSAWPLIWQPWVLCGMLSFSKALYLCKLLMTPSAIFGFNIGGLHIWFTNILLWGIPHGLGKWFKTRNHAICRVSLLSYYPLPYSVNVFFVK